MKQSQIYISVLVLLMLAGAVQATTWTIGQGGVSWSTNSSFDNFYFDPKIINVSGNLVLGYENKVYNGGFEDANTSSPWNVAQYWGNTSWAFQNIANFSQVSGITNNGTYSLFGNNTITSTDSIFSAWFDINNGTAYTSSVYVKTGWAWGRIFFVAYNTSIITIGVTSTAATQGTNTTWNKISTVYTPTNGLGGDNVGVGRIRIDRYNTAGNASFDNVKVNSSDRYNSSNILFWHDAGAGNETYQININVSADINNNYSVFYRTNGTGTLIAIGSLNSTGNQTISLTTKYQNTDIQIQMNGNVSASPVLIDVTLNDQASTAEAVIQTIDSTNQSGLGNELGQFSSIALDSNGYPHISYWGGYNNYSLKYAYYDGSIWHTETVVAHAIDSWSGKYTSIALDTNNHPHISYYGDTDLKYAEWNGSAWAITTVNNSLNNGDYWEGRYSSIVLNSSGYPRIAYGKAVAEGCYAVGYSEWTGNAWLSSEPDKYRQPWLPVGCSDNPNVSQQTAAAYRDISIGLDSNEYSHISYYAPAYHKLVHSWDTGTGWINETIDYEGGTGSSIVLNGSQIHISYSNNSALKYAHYNGSSWKITDIDIGVGAWFTSIDLDSNNYSHIAYFDYSMRNLKHAWFNGTGWTKETIDSAGDVGWYPSIKMNGTTAHFSYYDATNGSLKYATSTGTGTEITKGAESITGTSPNYAGVTNITSNTVWSNAYINLTSGLNIHDGYSLELNNTVLILYGNNLTLSVNHTSYLNISNNSILVAMVVNGTTEKTRNINICVGRILGISECSAPNTAGGIINANNSAFVGWRRIVHQGDGNLSGSPLDGRGRYFNDYFRDYTEEFYPNAVINGYGTSSIIIRNSTFYNIGSAITFNNCVNCTFSNNKIIESKLGTYTASSSSYKNNYILSKTIYEDIQTYGVIDAGVTGSYYIYIANNICINSGACVIYNGDISYGVVENNYLYYSNVSFSSKGNNQFYPGAFNTQYGIFRNYADGYYTVGPIAIANYEDSRQTNHFSYNITKTREQGRFLQSVMQNSSMFDMSFSAYSATYSAVLFHEGSYNYIPTYSKWWANTNNTYGNITINGSKYGIEILYGYDLRFIDWNFKNITTYDILLSGNSTNKTNNIQFINTNAVNISVGTNDIYEPYWYLDINVTASNGSAINGATITISNEVNASKIDSIIVRNGTARNIFTTDSSGHTTLPVNYYRDNIIFTPSIQYDANGDLIFLSAGQWYNWSWINTNDTTSIAIQDFRQNSTGYENYTYSVQVSAPGFVTQTKTGVNPNSTWYRPHPDSYQNTTNIILTSSNASNTTTIIVPANSWEMFNNWTTTNQTFSQISANISNDIAYSYYNVSSGEWENFYVGYSYNSANTINNQSSVMTFFNNPTTLTLSTVTPSNTNLKTGWNMLYVEGTSNTTLSAIQTNIEASPCSVSDRYRYNSTTNAYSNLASESLQPNEGFLVYIASDCLWTRTTI